MICVPIAEPNVERARQVLLLAASRADLVEVRVDQLDQLPDAAALAALLRDRPCPMIITCRPAALGGRHDWPDPVRLKTLQAAIELGADYIDVEAELAGGLQRRSSTRIIVSYHNFTSTPTDLASLYDRLVETGADVVKIATAAGSIIDSLRMLELVRHAAAPCIALCMGELGLITRVLGRKFGCLLSYAPLRSDRATAPGQITLDDLIGLYNYRAINTETQVYGVVANPIAHSMSPHIHNAAFRSLGINAVYVPFKVEGDVANFFDACRGMPVYGYSVTIPHKQAALRAVDEVDPISRKIGAVNTVVNRKGRLVGSNTDWSAAIEAIEGALAGAPLAGRRVALVGAGGTARAIAFGLRAKGADVCIYNRTPDRAAGLAADAACAWAPLEQLPSAEADVLVNSTSVGMYPNVDESPVPASVLKRNRVVFDAVYNPVWTRLLREAEQAGCVTVTGLEMFINQAAQQFKTWTGLTPPRELMEAVAR